VPPGNGSSEQAESQKFKWRPALREALFYTGVMHGFRFVTEPGTRDTLNGPFLRDYVSSVLATRGWDDGDTFVTSYVAHPMEGAIFGYIQRQNDPKYRTVQWGDGRAYWISLLRSLSFSAIMSTQWTLGPASEASIGNVQLHDSPGFVDLVGTPTLGVLLMVGEDAADRYLTTRLENHTSNIPLIILARCFLNPSRTWANLMAFRSPWVRETRMGLFGANHDLRKELLREYRAGTGGKPFEFRPGSFQRPSDNKAYPLEAPVELEASAYSQSFLGGHGTCLGGAGSGAARLSPAWQMVAEVGGCLVVGLPTNESGDILTYALGPRWTPRAGKRFSPYVQVLVGGTRVTHEVENPELRKKLTDEWKDGNGTLPHYPMRSDWSVEHQANGVELAAGAGLDIIFHRAFAWRVGRVEYTHSWLGGVDQIRAADTLRITTGAVLRIGTW